MANRPPDFLRSHPVYPPLLQAVRVYGSPVTQATYSGKNVYTGHVQQFVIGTGNRDREGCYVIEPNGLALSAGIYPRCRLIGTFQSLPLFETDGLAGAPSIFNNPVTFNDIVTFEGDTIFNNPVTYNDTTTFLKPTTFGDAGCTGTVVFNCGVTFNINSTPIFNTPVTYNYPVTYNDDATYNDPVIYNDYATYNFPVTYNDDATYNDPVIYNDYATYNFPVTFNNPVTYNDTTIFLKPITFGDAGCTGTVIFKCGVTFDIYSAPVFNTPVTFNNPITANGTVTLATPLPIGSGGTGGNNRTDAFDNIAPASPSTGDILRYDGSHWVKTAILPIGSGGTGSDGGSTTGIYPYWIKITKTYSDFSDAASTKQIVIKSMPAKGVLLAANIKHSTSFSGGEIFSYSIAVRRAGGAQYYISAFDVFQATGNTVLDQSNSLNEIPNAAGFDIEAEAIASHGLDTATAGSVDIWLLISALP